MLTKGGNRKNLRPGAKRLRGSSTTREREKQSESSKKILKGGG